MSAVTSVSHERAKATAIASVRRLSSMVRPDGTFAYRVHNAAVLPGYNLLRHCGAAWTIAEVASATGDMPQAAAAAASAMRFIIEKRMRPRGGGQCITAGKTTRLGGTGRAVLALLALDDMQKNRVFHDRAEALGHFILSCRRTDGEFDQRMEVRAKTVSGKPSVDHTGEAIFALARLYQHGAGRAMVDAARDSIARLGPGRFGVAGQSHWVVYALDALHAIDGEQRYLDHAAAICQAILDRPGYRDRGKSVPLATRTEALMTYAGMVRRSGQPEKGPSLHDVVTAAGENLSRLQRYLLEDGSFIGGDDDREIRIDYVQHGALAHFRFFQNLAG